MRPKAVGVSSPLIGASLLVIGILVGAGLFFLATHVNQGAVSTQSSGRGVTTSTVYKVAFKQLGACSPPAFVSPWSVTLGNLTEAEPSNATIPVRNDSIVASPSFENLSTIVFSVPNGVYHYLIYPPTSAMAMDPSASMEPTSR